MKAFFHIILIFLIGFFSSTFLFVLSPIDYEDSIVIEEPKNKPTLKLSVDIAGTLENPTNIIIKHTSDKEMKLASVPSNIFKATIYKDNELVNNEITNLGETTITFDNSEVSIDSDNPLSTNINISQEKLNIKDGHYKIVLTSSLIQDSKLNSIELDVLYDTGFTYFSAHNNNVKDHIGLTIYYPDIDKKAIIPVTRFVIKELSMNKQVMNELQQTPADTNLINLVGNVNYCIYKDNKVFIDLPYEDIYKSQIDGKLVYESINKSFFDMDKYLALDNISYTVNKAKPDSFFGGIDIKNDVIRTETPKIYLGYKVDKRMYLIDVDIKDLDLNSDIQTISNVIMDSYANVSEDYYSPISKDIKLLNVTQNGDNLVLDFSKDIINSYDNDQNRRKFLLDALVYTYTSIPGINSISIQAENEPITNFIEGVDITGKLTAPRFINPEAVE